MTPKIPYRDEKIILKIVKIEILQQKAFHSQKLPVFKPQALPFLWFGTFATYKNVNYLNIHQ